MSTKTVAIVGAGISGLAAIKSCLDYGFTPICYEIKEELGGVWAPAHPRIKDYNAGQAYDDLVTNSSKYQFAYSDFLFPDDTPLTVPRQQVLEYLQSYAEHFKLEPYIQFNTKVVSVKRAVDYDTTGRWTITTIHTKHAVDDETQPEMRTVDATMLCAGYFSREKLPPELEDRSVFQKGSVIHSSDFWNTDPYRGRRVAVVGAGISGVDIATMLAAAKTAQVYLIAPKGSYLFPAFYKGRHFDFALMDYKLNVENDDIEVIRGAIEKTTSWRYNLEALGLKPDGKLLSPDSSYAVTNDLDQYIYSGRIKIVRDGVSGFTENGLHLKSGAVLVVDDVILATGFRPHYPFLDEPKLFDDERPHDNSYLYLYPMEQTHPTLFTIVMMYTLQGIPGLSDLMTRAACAILRGDCILPTKSVMEEWLRAAKKVQVSLCGEYPGIVSFHPLRDELSRLIGCRPDMDELRKIDPELADIVQNGPMTSSVYRLFGPHSNWSLARKGISDADEFGKHSDWDLDDLRNFKV